MKSSKLILTAAISSAFLFTACSSGGGNAEAGTESDSLSTASEVVEDYSDMQEVDLSEYGMMASVFVPKSGKVEMVETSWGSVEIMVGDKFGMEVVPFGFTIAEKKDELKQSSVFETEIIEDKDNYFLYKKTIPNSEIMEEYHFFLNQTIDGEIYEVKSMADLELKEAQARKVLKAAKSLKAKPAM